MSALNRNQMAWRAAQDLADGSVVNLGLGMPVLVSNYITADRDIFLQSENGILGVGPEAEEGHQDRNLVDAGSRRVTLQEGASIVDSVASFAMIRGGHIDVTILGAFEVATNGDLANWDANIPAKGPLVGGAMDLAVGANGVWILMQHNTRDGGPRLLEACNAAPHRAGLRHPRLHRHRRRRPHAGRLPGPRSLGRDQSGRAPVAHRRPDQARG